MIARLLVALGAVLVLGIVDVGVLHKEALRRDGQVVFLELAPVDPRSLMQGDYMALNFRLAAEIRQRSWDAERNATGAQADLARHARESGSDEGEQDTVSLSLDPRRVASLAERGAAGTRLRYRIRRGQVWLGTNAFFFQEGEADRFEGARYGEFRLDPASGEALLVGLRDAGLRPL